MHENLQHPPNNGILTEFLQGVHHEGEGLPTYILDKAARCATISGVFGTLFWIDNAFVDRFLKFNDSPLPNFFWELNKTVVDHPLETIAGFTAAMTTFGVLASLRRFRH